MNIKTRIIATSCVIVLWFNNLSILAQTQQNPNLDFDHLTNATSSSVLALPFLWTRKNQGNGIKSGSDISKITQKQPKIEKQLPFGVIESPFFELI